MPRKPSNNISSGRDSAREPRTIEVEKTPFFQQIKIFFADRRTQVICAVILAAFSLFAFIAWLSYFITGAQDQSLLGMSHADLVAKRAQIANVMGMPGARLAELMIDDSFGLVSILFLLVSSLYAAKLFHWLHYSGWRILFCSVFWLVWGSITLGFLQIVTGLDTFFRWGGAHGEWLGGLLNSYVQPIGTTIILVAILIIFFIITDETFIPKAKRFCLWFVGLFKKKDNTQVIDTPAVTVTEDDDDTEDTTQTVTLKVDDIDVEPDPEDDPDDSETITIQIENPVTTEEPEDLEDPDEPDKPEDSEDTDKPEDPGLDINETDAVELSKQLEPYDPRKDLEHYKFPALDLLKVYDNETAPIINQEEQQANANRIVTTLRNYGIEIEQIKATVGPTVTLYEVVP